MFAYGGLIQTLKDLQGLALVLEFPETQFLVQIYKARDPTIPQIADFWGVVQAFT